MGWHGDPPIDSNEYDLYSTQLPWQKFLTTKTLRNDVENAIKNGRFELAEILEFLDSNDYAVRPHKQDLCRVIDDLMGGSGMTHAHKEIVSRVKRKIGNFTNVSSTTKELIKIADASVTYWGDTVQAGPVSTIQQIVHAYQENGTIRTQDIKFLRKRFGKVLRSMQEPKVSAGDLVSFTTTSYTERRSFVAVVANPVVLVKPKGLMTAVFTDDCKEVLVPYDDVIKLQGI